MELKVGMEKMSKLEKWLFIISIISMIITIIVGVIVSYFEGNIETAKGFGIFSGTLMVCIIMTFLLKLRNEKDS